MRACFCGNNHRAAHLLELDVVQRDATIARLSAVIEDVRFAAQGEIDEPWDSYTETFARRIVKILDRAEPTELDQAAAAVREIRNRKATENCDG
ncbi:MAG: hypothetical protein ACYCPT_13940 [Acidimicrobiales bacterium]